MDHIMDALSWWWNEEIQEAAENKKEAFKDWKKQDQLTTRRF